MWVSTCGSVSVWMGTCGMGVLVCVILMHLSIVSATPPIWDIRGI